MGKEGGKIMSKVEETEYFCEYCNAKRDDLDKILSDVKDNMFKWSHEMTGLWMIAAAINRLAKVMDKE